MKETSNTYTVENQSLMTLDLIEGDDSILERYDFSVTDLQKARKALAFLNSKGNLSERARQNLIMNSWKILFRQKPPTIDEFLSEEWLGSTAETILPHVREIMKEFFERHPEKIHLILGMAIGTGKALPDSSPVVVGEEEVVEFELEDGSKWSYGLEEEVFVYDPSPRIIKAKDLKIEQVNIFPVPCNYISMKYYEVKRFEDFKNAFEIGTYSELVDYFKDFTRDYYSERNIVSHAHHIVPKSEGGTDQKENFVNLPFYFHVKAHYFRAREYENSGNLKFALKNYYAVTKLLGIKTMIKEEKDFLKKLDFVVESLEKASQLQSKQFFIKKKGKRSFKIFEEEWEKYKALGWQKGRNFKNPTNKKWMNKDGQNFYIEKDEIEDYLNKGYSLGMYVTDKMKISNKKKSSKSTLGTKWMNKDGKRKCVKKEEVEEYIAKGWKLGSASKTVQGQTWKWKEENLNRHRYTNGKDFIWAKECPEGYWEVEHHLSGVHWYTDGEKTIAANECPEGFRPGRTQKQRSNENKENNQN